MRDLHAYPELTYRYALMLVRDKSDSYIFGYPGQSGNPCFPGINNLYQIKKDVKC